MNKLLILCDCVCRSLSTIRINVLQCTYCIVVSFLDVLALMLQLLAWKCSKSVQRRKYLLPGANCLTWEVQILKFVTMRCNLNSQLPNKRCTHVSHSNLSLNTMNTLQSLWNSLAMCGTPEHFNTQQLPNHSTSYNKTDINVTKLNTWRLNSAINAIK